MAAVICRSAKQSIICFRKKLFVGMKTYHVLKNNVPVEISIEDMFKENDEEILLDVNWYLNNGYITDEDFLKSHCELPIMEGL